MGGISGLINGPIAAAIGALSMLMSEPTAKSYVKKTSVGNNDVSIVCALKYEMVRMT